MLLGPMLVMVTSYPASLPAWTVTGSRTALMSQPLGVLAAAGPTPIDASASAITPARLTNLLIRERFTLGTPPVGAARRLPSCATGTSVQGSMNESPNGERR